jgi:hypothetical protein
MPAPPRSAAAMTARSPSRPISGHSTSIRSATCVSMSVICRRRRQASKSDPRPALRNGSTGFEMSAWVPKRKRSPTSPRSPSTRSAQRFLRCSTPNVFLRVTAMVDPTLQHKNRAEVLVDGAEIIVQAVGKRQGDFASRTINPPRCASTQSDGRRVRTIARSAMAPPSGTARSCPTRPCGQPGRRPRPVGSTAFILTEQLTRSLRSADARSSLGRALAALPGARRTVPQPHAGPFRVRLPYRRLPVCPIRC